MALIASELGSALPGEGGFYVWARRALGDFWGFQTAWWWSLSIFVDSSVYIVLIVGPFRNLVVIDVILFISAYVLIFISAVRLRIREPDLKRPFRIPFGTAGMIAMVIPPILIVLFTIYVNAIDRSTVLLGFDGFNLLGVDVGWYGIAGFMALFSGPVLYYVFRAIYGGPSNRSSEAGNDALALAEAEAAEDAA